MRRVKHGFKRLIVSSMAFLMVVAFPVAAPHALADTAPTAPPAPTTSASPTTPPPKPVYTYDPSTGHWNTQEWFYDAKTGTYQPVIKTTTTPPAGATTPTTPTSPSSTPPSSTAPVTTTTTTSPSNPTNTTNTTTNKTSATANTNATTNNTIGNTIQGTSTTGNADVTSNNKAGSATTGTAAASATLTNIVNTTTSDGAGTSATFTTNVNGNVNGDIVLYPMIMAALLQAAAHSPTTTTTNSGGTTNTTSQSSTSNTNANTTTGVTNGANLAATSGNANVANNTTAGNATSGNATAVGNIINMINSAIAAGSSFVGTINIYGNLNGNILVSPDFIPSLITSNANTTTNAHLSDNQAITNNVKLAATSGNASVANNTNAGNATTGTAKTNLVLLNLTGHQVVAQNSLLVFVNVMGTWVGMIVDAAPGATSAALGTGVTTNLTDTTNVNATNNATITNNLNLAANSGNATVAHNTTAGSATSGNAMAGANILNISQSNIGLSGWFGILFINVFGSWLGSFGVDTPPHGSNPPQVSTSSDAPATPQAIQFVSQGASTFAHKLLKLPTSATGSGSSGAGQLPLIGVTASNDDSQQPPADPMPTSSTRLITIPQTTTGRTPSNLLAAGTIITTVFLAGIALRRIYGDMVTTSVLLASS